MKCQCSFDRSNFFDLRHATIYFSVLGGEGKRRAAARGLASARGLVRSRVAKSLALREAPAIRFEFDPSVERAIQVSKLIEEVSAELHEHDGDAEPSQEECPPDGYEDGQDAGPAPE